MNHRVSGSVTGFLWLQANVFFSKPLLKSVQQMHVFTFEKVILLTKYKAYLDTNNRFLQLIS